MKTIKTLRQYILEADQEKRAVGHFNAPTLEIFHAIANAARDLDLPVIIGVAEGEEDFMGRDEAVALVKLYREKYNQPIFLNADHHYSFERVKACIDAGFDAVIIDAVKLPLEENIALTKKCVDYAREITKQTGRDIIIEAEIGFIGTSSKILDELPEGVNENTLTKPQDAKYFIDQTGVDMLAPSIGNVHGMVKGGNPRLHPELVKEIRELCNIPLVLHGGSGSMDQDFMDCIKNGVDVVHISTEIRKAFRETLEEFMKENPEEVAPYKYLNTAKQAAYDVVYKRLKLFNGIA